MYIRIKGVIRKRNLLLLVLLLSVLSVHAANDRGDKEQPKFYVGGNLGLQFGTITLIDVSPWISYRIIPQFSVGVGGTYKYYRYNLLNTKIQRSYYGGRGFLRYYPSSESIEILNQIFLHAEYEILEMHFDANDNDVPNQQVESLFGGVGYQIPFGKHVNGEIYLLYDFKQSGYSPYKNPMMRVGVSVGL